MARARLRALAWDNSERSDGMSGRGSFASEGRRDRHGCPADGCCTKQVQATAQEPLLYGASNAEFSLQRVRSISRMHAAAAASNQMLSASRAEAASIEPGRPQIDCFPSIKIFLFGNSSFFVSQFALSISAMANSGLVKEARVKSMRQAWSHLYDAFLVAVDTGFLSIYNINDNHSYLLWALPSFPEVSVECNVVLGLSVPYGRMP